MLNTTKLRDKRTRHETRRKVLAPLHNDELDFIKKYSHTKRGMAVAVHREKRIERNAQRHHRKMNGEHRRNYGYLLKGAN